MAIRKDLIQYLQYVQNTGGNATVATLDDDYEPIGPMVRKELMPKFMFETSEGKLALTEAGLAELRAQKS
jgi:hypothetical protein